MTDLLANKVALSSIFGLIKASSTLMKERSPEADIQTALFPFSGPTLSTSAGVV